MTGDQPDRDTSAADRLRPRGHQESADGLPPLEVSQWATADSGPARILIVDDDEQMRRLVCRILGADDFELEVASSAQDALERGSQSSFSLMISDVHMPGSSGVDLVRQLRMMQPNLGLLMISGDDRPLVAAAAAERGGAYAYLTKPFTSNELRINVANALLRRRLEVNATAYQRQLKQAIDQRTTQLQDAIQVIGDSQEATIGHLERAIELRDPSTRRHLDRVGEISSMLAQATGWTSDQAESLQLAATVHDIGKIGTPDRILFKATPLTAAERHEMERHTTLGHEILTDSESQLLTLAAVIALSHHERFDGLGYPSQLSGDGIPEAARIVKVADAFDTLLHARVYRPAFALREAIEIMRAGRGTQFDPVVLDALFASAITA